MASFASLRGPRIVLASFRARVTDAEDGDPSGSRAVEAPRVWASHRNRENADARSAKPARLRIGGARNGPDPGAEHGLSDLTFDLPRAHRRTDLARRRGFGVHL